MIHFLALDRSSSIQVSSTKVLKDFMKQFIAKFKFDPNDHKTSAQLGIVQWYAAS
jgi:uncharacterized protein YegL